MATRLAREARRVANTVAGVAEDVFQTITFIHRQALDRYEEVVGEGTQLPALDVAALRPSIHRLLEEKAGTIIGLGMVVAPHLLPQGDPQLEWWQLEPGRSAPVRLNVDLNPSSLGFYDYAAAEWFDVPRRSGGRHIVGPYVDVHGTGRYILTFTMPIQARGHFLGVVGADVSAAWFETRVLRALDPRFDIVILNAARRVVLSTSPPRLVGGLLPRDRAASTDATVSYQDVRDLPWQVRLRATTAS